MSNKRADSDTIEFAVALFAALAHPTRYRMVEELALEEHTVGDLAQRLGISQPNASLHLAILQRAGAIKATPHGAQRVYRIRGPRISQVLALVTEYRGVHADNLRKETVLDSPLRSDEPPVED